MMNLLKTINRGFGILAIGFLSSGKIAHAADSKVTLQDGRVLETPSVKGEKDGFVSVQRTLAPGVVADVAYDPRTVSKVEFPENPKLKQAMDLLDRGRPAEALALINPVFYSHQNLSSIPGNNAAASAVIKVKALQGLNREAEARQLVDQLTKNADDPEVIRAALVEIMSVWAKAGGDREAAAYYDKVIAESTNPETIAAAWCHKGDSLLSAEQYDSALLAYLRVPTLYPDQVKAMPQILLGVSRSYLGINDKKKARNTFQRLVAEYPGTPEADRAKKDLQDLQKDEAESSESNNQKLSLNAVQTPSNEN